MKKSNPIREMEETSLAQRVKLAEMLRCHLDTPPAIIAKKALRIMRPDLSPLEIMKRAAAQCERDLKMYRAAIKDCEESKEA